MLCDAPVHENTAFSGYTVTESTSVHEIVASGGQSVKQPEFYVEPLLCADGAKNAKQPRFYVEPRRPIL